MIEGAREVSDDGSDCAGVQGEEGEPVQFSLIFRILIFQLLEVFGTGTAASVAPVKRIVYADKVSSELYNLLPTKQRKSQVNHEPVILDIPERREEEAFYAKVHKTLYGIQVTAGLKNQIQRYRVQYGTIDRPEWIRLVF